MTQTALCTPPFTENRSSAARAVKAAPRYRCRVLAEIRRAASAPLKAARVPAYAGIAGGTVELIASSCFLQDEAFFALNAH